MAVTATARAFLPTSRTSRSAWLATGGSPVFGRRSPEASGQALADMVDCIGGTVLARTERVEAINEARDQGRYLEIRGDAGVGKSGVLKHLRRAVRD